MAILDQIKSQGRTKAKRLTPEEKQTAILDAAYACFAEHGFSSARMDDIAAKACVGKGTIYLYYPNKPALFEALIKRDISPRVEKLISAVLVYQGSLDEALKLILEVLATMIEKGQVPIYPKLLMAEAHRFPQLAQIYRDEVVLRILTAFTTLFQRAMDEGQIETGDAYLTAHLFIAPIVKSIMWSFMFGQFDNEDFPVRVQFSQHCQQFLRGLRT